MRHGGMHVMGSAETAGNTRLRSARQALGLRSQQQLAEAITRVGLGIGLRISITERTVRRCDRAPVRSAGHRTRFHPAVGRRRAGLDADGRLADDRGGRGRRAAGGVP